MYTTVLKLLTIVLQSQSHQKYKFCMSSATNQCADINSLLTAKNDSIKKPTATGRLILHIK